MFALILKYTILAVTREARFNAKHGECVEFEMYFLVFELAFEHVLIAKRFLSH